MGIECIKIRQAWRIMRDKYGAGVSYALTCGSPLNQSRQSLERVRW